MFKYEEKTDVIHLDIKKVGYQTLLYYCIKKDMKLILLYIFLIGLISCSTNSQDKKVVGKKPTEESQIETKTVGQTNNYREIVISENSLDTFSIPFPEKNMLMPLKSYYEPYWVEANIGQQDGPDFTYIDILKDDDNPIAYLNFAPDNKFKLEEIRIVSSSAIDQYGVRVGDTYQEVREKRNNDFKNSTNYHQHTYLYPDSSNIFYELTGDFTMTEEMLENLNELGLTEEQPQNCKVDYIIWRKRK
ncbi:hypothetical protein [uncultured Cyclobacterium sp.]|uniref:hypothetical protein n=1 Tax=uncultured Cyclobacterium sp. TaxID=453820 RepID=UPI0030EB474B